MGSFSDDGVSNNSFQIRNHEEEEKAFCDFHASASKLRLSKFSKGKCDVLGIFFFFLNL